MLPVSDSMNVPRRQVHLSRLIFADTSRRPAISVADCCGDWPIGTRLRAGSFPASVRPAGVSPRCHVMNRLAVVACLASVVAVTLPAMDADARERRGPTRYYDQYGQDRGYEWCFRRGRENSWNCNYYTWEQCQANAPGQLGYCERNPWAINPRG
jgi:hypothetical protein